MSEVKLQYVAYDTESIEYCKIENGMRYQLDFQECADDTGKKS